MTAPPFPPSPWRRARPWLATLAGLAVSAGFLYLATRDVAWRAFVANLERVEWRWTAVAFGLAVVSYGLRGLRYPFLFDPSEAPGWWSSQRGLLIHYAANNLLPGRAGWLLRAQAMRHMAGLRRTRVIATVLVERIFDALALLLLLLVGLPLLEIRVPFLREVGWLGGALLAALAGLSVLAVRCSAFDPEDVGRQEAGGLAGRWEWRRRVADFVAGLQSLRSQGRMGAVASLSVAIWALETVVFWAVLVGFCPGGVPFEAALSVTVVANVGSMLTAGQGALGTFEFWGVQALGPWGYGPEMALGMACVYHAVHFSLSTLGGLCAWGTLLGRPPVATTPAQR